MTRLTWFSIIAAGALILASAASAGEIHEAAKNGQVEEVRTLVASDTALINAADDAGNTPLHLACTGGQLEAARVLIDAGAELDAINKQAMTPLRLAIQSVQVETVRLLLDRGSATEDNHPMFGSVMNQAFVITCQRGGDPALVDLLIERGLELDAGKIDALGMAPLDWAVHFSNLPLAQRAVEHGADVNLVCQRLGRPPLVSAVTNGSEGIVSLLLEHDADVSVTDDNGNPPIFYAVDQGRTAILAKLLAYGASTDYIEPHYGRNLIHVAAIKGYTDVAQMLVAHGGSIDAHDNSGKTPLFYAANYGNRDVADYLAEQGAAARQDPFENYDRPADLTDKVDPGEADIRYLNHRGWTVKTSDHLLVFDAEEFGVRRSDNPSLNNGFLTAAELKGQKVIGLYSCYHGYPGEPAYIHTLADSVESIAYVHLVDDAWRGSPSTTYLKGEADTAAAEIKIQTIDIADYMPMLAYLCHVDGLIIYYQAFATDDPDKLRQRYEFLKQYADTIDVAFLPMPEPQSSGTDIELLLEQLPAHSIVLLDPSRREYMFGEAAVQIAEQGYPVKVFCAENPGDQLVYRPDDK